VNESYGSSSAVARSRKQESFQPENISKTFGFFSAQIKFTKAPPCGEIMALAFLKIDICSVSENDAASTGVKPYSWLCSINASMFNGTLLAKSRADVCLTKKFGLMDSTPPQSRSKVDLTHVFPL
jgi:hypothetical protein